MLGLILLFTFLGSVVSLIGGVVLLFKEKLVLKASHFFASFAAGTLLGAAFFDLLPEASEERGDTNIFLWTLIGILVFFLLERFIHWFHHHHEHPAHRSKSSDRDDKHTIPLIIFGDSVHNFIDGVVIAATFLSSIHLGIVTTLAVAAHEIPQEIGDFGMLLHRGLSRKKVLFFNVLSALTAMVGAILTFFIGDFVKSLLPLFLSVTSGFFIYIAASDLIPEIHEEKRRGFAFMESVLLLIGVLVVWVFVSLLE